MRKIDRKTIFKVLLISVWLVVNPLTFSHHSMSRFDTNSAIDIEGIVKRLDWRNPHIYIYLDQALESGEIVEWEVEGHAPIVMHRIGWTKEHLHPEKPFPFAATPITTLM